MSTSNDTTTIVKEIITGSIGQIDTKEKAQQILDMKPFNECFYGCRLDAQTLKWVCKKFYTDEAADNYAFQNRESTLATRLIPVSCVGSIMPDFIQSYRLFNKVNFPVNIDKN